MFCANLIPDTTVDIAGGKAAQLARLHALGVPVPESRVVTRSALRRVVQSRRVAPLLESYARAFTVSGHGHVALEAFAELGRALSPGELPADLREEVLEVGAELLATTPYGLAVRSSAVYEDSATASFAGVFASRVGVMSPDGVVEAVVECWRSGWSPRALRYLKRMGIEPQWDGMAVLLQHVVPATCSGVLTTANPATGNPWEFVLRATRGLSLDLMSGSGVGDEFVLDWDTGDVQRQEIVKQHTALVATVDGLRQEQLSGKATPSLDLAELHRVAAVGRRLDATLNERLDIEWTLAGEQQLLIVQARPLTALPAFFPLEGVAPDRTRSWRRALVVLPMRPDQPANLLTPVYEDISEAECWHRHQPEDIVLTTAWSEECDVNGFRYTDTRPPRTFVEFFRDAAGYEAWLDTNEAPYRTRWDGRQAALDRMAARGNEAIRVTDTSRALIPVMLSVRDEFWDWNAFGWSGPQSLGWMCEALLTRYVSDIDRELDLSGILGGGLDTYTFTVASAWQALGRSVQEDVIREAFERLPLDAILPHILREQPTCAFLQEYEAACWRLGRTPPSWHARPPFWSFGSTVEAMHAIKRNMTGETRDVVALQQLQLALREQRETVARGRIREAGGSVERFDKILGWTRYWSQALTDRHGLAPGPLWEKEVIWQVGARLTTETLLDAPEHVLTLRRQDLEHWVTSGDRSAFIGAARDGRHAYETHRRLVAPEFLGAPISSDDPKASPPESAQARAEPQGTESWSGKGFAPGHAVGYARKVADLGDHALLSLTPEDILVLPYEHAFAYADWHTLLTLVKGIVSPGRPAHHLTQVARECGVPVIGDVSDDLQRIPDGARLSMDASAGIVQLES